MSDIVGVTMAAVVITVGTTEAARIVKKQMPTMKPVLGGAALGGLLLLMGMVSGELATGFAYLAIIGALLINGVGVFQGLGMVN